MLAFEIPGTLSCNSAILKLIMLVAQVTMAEPLLGLLFLHKRLAVDGITSLPLLPRS